MSRVRAQVVRTGLVFFSGISAVLGVYILITPESFFSLSWVNLGMAYNPHLLLDYGAMTLATAVVLGGAAVSMHLAFVRTALASYSVWSIAHFLIHLQYRTHHLTHGSVTGLEANLLVLILGIGAAASIALLGLTLGGRGRGRGRGRRGVDGSGPETPDLSA